MKLEELGGEYLNIRTAANVDQVSGPELSAERLSLTQLRILYASKLWQVGVGLEVNLECREKYNLSVVPDR